MNTAEAVKDDLTNKTRNALLKTIEAEALDLGSIDPKTTDVIELRSLIREARLTRKGASEGNVLTGLLSASGEDAEGAEDVEGAESGEGTEGNENNEQPDYAPKLELFVTPIRQLGHDAYLAAIKYRDLKHIEVHEDVQRPEARRRIPEIAKYVLDGNGYFGAVMLTVIDAAPGEPSAVMLIETEEGPKLIIEQHACIVVNDGQHRIAGVKKAISLDPHKMDTRMNDELPVVIYVGLNKTEQRQLFADVNLNAAKPPKAIALNYNQRNLRVQFAKRLVEESPVFRGKVNYRKTRVGATDPELFTFSTVVDIVTGMFDDLEPSNFERRIKEAKEFWSEADDVLGEKWERKDTIAGTKNALVAVAKLFGDDVNWTALGKLDWSADGELDRIVKDAGGTNAATTQLNKFLMDRITSIASN